MTQQDPCAISTGAGMMNRSAEEGLDTITHARADAIASQDFPIRTVAISATLTRRGVLRNMAGDTALFPESVVREGWREYKHQ